MLTMEVAFHSAYIRESEDLLGPRLKSALRPARKGESNDSGGIRRTTRKAPREIQ